MTLSQEKFCYVSNTTVLSLIMLPPTHISWKNVLDSTAWSRLEYSLKQWPQLPDCQKDLARVWGILKLWNNEQSNYKYCTDVYVNYFKFKQCDL